MKYVTLASLMFGLFCSTITAQEQSEFENFSFADWIYL